MTTTEVQSAKEEEIVDITNQAKDTEQVRSFIVIIDSPKLSNAMLGIDCTDV